MHHNRIQAEIESKKVRINQRGGGRKPQLEIKKEICLCIFYLRQMPTFEILKLQFGISKTEANDTFHYRLKILRNILPASLIEKVEINDSEHAIALKILNEFQLIVDSMEQLRSKPSVQKEQKKYFAVKKKQHRFKNQLITLPFGKDIVDVEVGEKGSTSDISWFRKQQQKFGKTQMFEGDKAYQGGKNIKTHYKKPRNRELTAQQKAESKEFSSRRIFVEHVIRLVKNFPCCSTEVYT